MTNIILLSDIGQETLHDLETIIETGLQIFIDVGPAARGGRLRQRRIR